MDNHFSHIQPDILNGLVACEMNIPAAWRGKIEAGASFVPRMPSVRGAVFGWDQKERFRNAPYSTLTLRTNDVKQRSEE
jgi:hypothetical protein